MVVITKEFLEEYYVLLGKLMYGNVDTVILCIILLDEYLVHKCNINRIKAYS